MIIPDQIVSTLIVTARETTDATAISPRESAFREVLPLFSEHPQSYNEPGMIIPLIRVNDLTKQLSIYNVALEANSINTPYSKLNMNGFKKSAYYDPELHDLITSPSGTITKCSECLYQFYRWLLGKSIEDMYLRALIESNARVDELILALQKTVLVLQLNMQTVKEASPVIAVSAELEDDRSCPKSVNTIEGDDDIPKEVVEADKESDSDGERESKRQRLDNRFVYFFNLQQWSASIASIDHASR
jgi:hypothetical protein